MKKALLLINLGSPESPEILDVKSYLKQFLMDEEVIDIPWLFRWPLVHWVIVPSRVRNSAHAYEKIFTPQGSPLKFITEAFTQQVRQSTKKFDAVEYAMRYAVPSVPSVVEELVKKGISELVVVPLYPQFAKSSTRTALKEVRSSLLRQGFPLSKVKVLRDFFVSEAYTSSYAKAIQEDIENFQPDHLLLSYHGLPESHVKEFAPSTCFQNKNCCDQIHNENRLCYRAQCFASSQKILKSLDKKISASVSFQSRLGRQEWIKPYTDMEISRLIENGVKNLLVACPAFVADCLETLEEIAIRLKEDFVSLGGKDLKLVSSLNTRPYWVKSFTEMMEEEEQNLSSLLEVLRVIES